MKLGMIGFGNMATAMLEGLLLKNTICPRDVYVCAAHYDTLKERAQKYGANACEKAQEVIDRCDMILLAVKPYQAQEVCAPLDFKNKTVVSVMAGQPFDKLSGIVKNGALICTIPNTPIAVAQGILLVENRTSASEKQYEQFEQLFSAVSLIVQVDAEHMNIAVVLSSCAPAFTEMYLEALGDAGVKYGLKRSEAYDLAAKMIEGVGALYLAQKNHPGAMKDAVCSPGGTTIKGVCALEKEGFRNAVISAVDAIEQ